jgi:hypothetical protein
MLLRLLALVGVDAGLCEGVLTMSWMFVSERRMGICEGVDGDPYEAGDGMCDIDALCTRGVCGEGAADGEDPVGACGEWSCVALGIERERLLGLFFRAERLACTLGDVLMEEAEADDCKPCVGTEMGEEVGIEGTVFLMVRTGTKDWRESGGSISNATSSSFCCVERSPLMCGRSAGPSHL